MKQKITEIFEKIRRRVLVWRVNRALGIRLFDWQITKIFDDEPFPETVQHDRRTGKTTAQILFVLLCPKLKKSQEYGFPPRLYVEERLKYPGVDGIDVNWEAARIAFFFGDDGVSFFRRYIFLTQMIEIAYKLHAAKIKTHRVSYVYRHSVGHIPPK